MIRDNTLADRLVARLSDDGLAIFLFHGVIKHQRHRVRNYTGKHIDADLFAWCMKKLSLSGYALSMDEVLGYCQTSVPFPPRSFAITFDDGFENNVSVAVPILADLYIPSIIYVTSGFIEENGMSWIDRIEYAIEEASNQILKVEWANNPFPLIDDVTRISFLKTVREYVKNNPNCNANAFADELCACLGKPGKLSSDDPLDLKMTWDQTRKANESNLISIGGHSHTHAILSFLSQKQLNDEITTSLFLLHERAGVAPKHYSYPEGLAHCYSESVIQALKKRGVQCCPTAIDGVNNRDTDPFHIKRIMVS